MLAKRKVYFLALIVFFLALPVTQHSKPTEVFAADGLPDINFVTKSGDQIYFDSSFIVEASIIDRARIKVAVKGTNQGYEIKPGEPLLKTYLEGIYYDENLNSEFIYRNYRTNNEDDTRTHIDLTPGSNNSLSTALESANGKFDNPDYVSNVDPNTLFDNYLKKAELTVVVDEDDIRSGDGCNGDYSYVLDYDGNNNITWQCASAFDLTTGASDTFDTYKKYTGFNIPETRWVNLENFNISYRYNGQAGEAARLEYVSEDGGGEFDFVFCKTAKTTSKQNVFVRNSCADGAKHEIIELTPEEISRDRLNPATIVDREGDSVRITIAGPDHATADDGRTSSVTGGLADTAPSCQGGAGALGWLLCPVLEYFLSGAQTFFGDNSSFQQLLIVKVDTSPGNALYDTWRGFVTIANVLFVVAGLAIIFAQSLSLNIDAYTIKRSLPRLVAGIILVQISIYLVAFLVDIFNVLGVGIGSLITSPVNGQGIVFSTDFSPFGTFLNSIVTSLAAAAIVGILLYLVFTSIPILILLIFAMFTTLVFRQLLIAILIVIAPVALVAWILPNTERFTRLWFSTLWKALAMFPIITLILGSGTLASSLLFDQAEGFGGGSEITNPSIAFASLIVAFAPFALIPFAFKFAGGAIATLSGALQGGARSGGGIVKSGVKGAAKLGLEERKKAQRGQETLFGTAGRLARNPKGTIGAMRAVRGDRKAREGAGILLERIKSGDMSGEDAEAIAMSEPDFETHYNELVASGKPEYLALAEKQLNARKDPANSEFMRTAAGRRAAAVHAISKGQASESLLKTLDGADFEGASGLRASLRSQFTQNAQGHGYHDVAAKSLGINKSDYIRSLSADALKRTSALEAPETTRELFNMAFTGDERAVNNIGVLLHGKTELDPALRTQLETAWQDMQNAATATGAPAVTTKAAEDIQARIDSVQGGQPTS